MKNALLKALTPRIHPGPSSHQRILIVSTTGLGDTLWATPAIRALKEHLPQGHLAILTSPIGNEVLKNSPFIDQFFVAKDPVLPNSFNLIRALRQNAFDTILVFHTSQRPMLSLCCLAKPKHIVGTYGLNKGLDSLLTHAMDLKTEHEIERRLRITSHVGAQAKTEDLDWFISAGEQHLADAFLSPFKKPIIGLHPGAKDAFKQWPPEHFIALGKQLAECGAQILVTGNNDEKALAEKVATAIPHAQSIAGALPLRTFAAALSKFSLFVTNDTGPMHISFAVKTKTVAFFGPTDPNLCGPHQASNCLIFAKSRTCTPCLKKACKDAFCMRQLGPQQIMADVKQFYMGEKNA